VRRASLAIVVLALALLAPTAAGADEQIPAGEPWAGSTVVTPGEVNAPVGELAITGRIQNGSSLTYSRPAVAVTLDGDLDTGCDTGPDGPAVAATLEGPTFEPRIPARWKRYTYSADLPFERHTNGDVPVHVCINGLPRLTTEVPVRLPAPTVTGLVATAEGHAITLTWDDMRSLAADVSGYRVQRSIGGGPFEEVGTAPADAPTFTDTTLPSAGGEATYQVVAQRPFVADAAPSGPASATFAAAPAGEDGTGGPVAGGNGSGTGGTGSGGTGSGGTAPGGSGGSGGPGGSGGSGGGADLGGLPTIRVPRVGTPSRNFFPALLAPPVSDTYDTELPFDDPEPGEDDPVLPSGLAVDDAEPLPGKGLAVPLATGLVLAVWALHLRFLARAARPTYEADERIEILRT
jgi:hypothetical protein